MQSSLCILFFVLFLDLLLHEIGRCQNLICLTITQRYIPIEAFVLHWFLFVIMLGVANIIS